MGWVISSGYTADAQATRWLGIGGSRLRDLVWEAEREHKIFSTVHKEATDKRRKQQVEQAGKAPKKRHAKRKTHVFVHK